MVPLSWSSLLSSFDIHLIEQSQSYRQKMFHLKIVLSYSFRFSWLKDSEILYHLVHRIIQKSISFIRFGKSNYRTFGAKDESLAGV